MPSKSPRIFAAAFLGGILCLFLAKGKGVVVKRREEEREMRRERRRDNVVVSVVVNGCPDQRRNFHVEIEIQSQTGAGDVCVRERYDLQRCGTSIDTTAT